MHVPVSSAGFKVNDACRYCTDVQQIKSQSVIITNMCNKLARVAISVSPSAARGVTLLDCVRGHIYHVSTRSISDGVLNDHDHGITTLHMQDATNGLKNDL